MTFQRNVSGASNNLNSSKVTRTDSYLYHMSVSEISH